MAATLTVQVDVSAAILSRSDVGRDAARSLLLWLEDTGLSLDGREQDAVLQLLIAAWAGRAGTVRDLLREV